MPHHTDGKSIQVAEVLGNTFSSKGPFICAQQNAGEPKFLNMALKTPVPKFLLFVVPTVLLLCWWYRWNCQTACAGWGCINNHIQDHSLKSWNADIPLPSTITPVDIQQVVLPYLSIYGCKCIVVWYYQSGKCSCCNCRAILPFPSAPLYKKQICLRQVNAATALLKSPYTNANKPTNIWEHKTWTAPLNVARSATWDHAQQF